MTHCDWNKYKIDILYYNSTKLSFFVHSTSSCYFLSRTICVYTYIYTNDKLLIVINIPFDIKFFVVEHTSHWTLKGLSELCIKDLGPITSVSQILHFR